MCLFDLLRVACMVVGAWTRVCGHARANPPTHPPTQSTTHNPPKTKQIFRSLGCADEASCRALTRSHDQDRGEEPPHLILLVRVVGDQSRRGFVCWLCGFVIAWYVYTRSCSFR